MESHQSLEQWAKTTEFSQPVLWGQVEAAILARPLPPDTEPEVPGLGTGVLGKIGMIPVVILGVALYGSSIAGLVLVLLAVAGSDATTAATLIGIANITFVAALAVPLTALAAWGQARRPGPWDLPLAAGTAAVSLVALVVLLINSASVDVRVAQWLSLADVVLGTAVSVVILVASKPGRRYPSVRRQKLTPEQERYRGMRTQVMEIIVKRGLVDEKDVDMVGMTQMPLGSWRDLDQYHGH